MPDNTTPGNASFNSATVGIANVGTVRVGRIDPRTGGPADGQNDLVDQIKKLGDDLSTSLGAMLDQLRTIRGTTTSEARASTRHQGRVETSDRVSQRTEQSLIDLNKKVLETLQETLKSTKVKDQELLDGIQQMTHGSTKDITAGLKNFTASHRTVMRDIMQLIRDQASNKLGIHGERERKAQNQRDAKFQAAMHRAQITLGGRSTPEGRKAMSEANRNYTFGNAGGRSLTYAREKWTETVHNQAESFAMNVDRAVGGLLSFANTTSYATKKWKQFNDVAGAGLDSFAHFFGSDFLKLVGLGGNGDNLGVTAEALNKGAQAGMASRDTQLFLAGKSLQQASEEIRAMRKGVQKGGFDTDAFMDFKDANDVLHDILTQLKRGGMLDQMDKAQTHQYMVDQLKQMQLTAENTALTLKQVAKLTEDARKKATILQAGGTIKDQNKPMWDAFAERFAAVAPEFVNRALEIQGSGGMEQWTKKNPDAAKAMMVAGQYDSQRAILDILNSGRKDTAEGQREIQRIAMQMAQDSHARIQENNTEISGALTQSDAAYSAALNQIAKFTSKNAPGQGDGVMSTVNSWIDTFTNKFPLDALKALIGVPGLLVSANILLAKIALNTGGLGIGSMLKGGGKVLKGAGGMIGRGVAGAGTMLGGLLGLGGAGAAAATAAAAPAMATAGLTAATAAGPAAAMASGGLGAALKGAGKVALKGVPLVGGLVGGALDRAGGGSLLEAILAGAGTGALAGGGLGLMAGGVGAIPGALIGGLGGAATGALGYGAADLFMGPREGTGPNPPSYAATNSDGLGSLARGMFDRMDIQIAKLNELVEIMKISNQTAAMNSTIIRQTATINNGDVGESGSWLGAIKRMWG